MTNNNNRRDLDMSDVLSDASDMFDAFLNDLAYRTDDIELARLRYKYGPDARQGQPEALAVVSTIDWVYGGRDSWLLTAEGDDPVDERDYDEPEDDDSYDEGAFYGSDY